MKIFGKNWAGILVLVCMVLVAGCEGTNVQLAVQAGMDALKAATLTDEQVRVLAVQASIQSDGQHRIAGRNPFHHCPDMGLDTRLDCPGLEIDPAVGPGKRGTEWT